MVDLPRPPRAPFVGLIAVVAGLATVGCGQDEIALGSTSSGAVATTANTGASTSTTAGGMDGGGGGDGGGAPIDAGVDAPFDASIADAMPDAAPTGITAGELLTGSWSEIDTLGVLPSKRHECGFAEVGGRMYLVGGRGSKKTGIYDPEANTWSEGLAPPIELHHFQPIGFDDRIWIFAALTGGFPMEPPAVDTFVYDPARDAWSTESPLPEGRHRGAAGVAMHDDKFYVVSGIQNGHWDGWVPWFDEYDPATGAWKQMPDAPRSRDHVAVAVIGDKLYVAGGRRSSWADGQNFNLTEPAVDVFDFALGSWSTLEATLPTERAAPSVVAVDGFILVVGGEAGDGSGGATAFDTVEALDLSTEQWLTLSPLSRPRHATSAVLWAGRIFTAAGSGGGGGSPELNSLDVWSLPAR